MKETKIKKIAVTDKDYIYYVEDCNRTLHVAEGVVEREVMLEADGVVQTNKDERLLFCKPQFKDHVDRMKRNAAVMNNKDVGMIITECGLTKDSIVIDAGSGSGGAACRIGALVKKVYTYDVKEAHVKLVQENIARLGLDNVECQVGDITQINAPEQADCLVLDIPDASTVVAAMKKLVKQGGFVAVYQTQINQVQKLITALDADFKYIKTLELIERNWVVDATRLRPDHKMLGHTAFLTFLRVFTR